MNHTSITFTTYLICLAFLPLQWHGMFFGGKNHRDEVGVPKFVFRCRLWWEKHLLNLFRIGKNIDKVSTYKFHPTFNDLRVVICTLYQRYSIQIIRYSLEMPLKNTVKIGFDLHTPFFCKWHANLIRLSLGSYDKLPSRLKFAIFGLNRIYMFHAILY